MSDLRDRILKTLREYLMSNMADDLGCGYPLVDLCTPPKRPITEGEEELFLIADAIAGELTKDEIKSVSDGEILAAFRCGRKEMEIDMDTAVEISGGDLAQLDVEFDDPPSDYEKPDWDKVDRVHCWRNYISDEMRALWPTFNGDQKQAIARQADNLAGAEDWE